MITAFSGLCLVHELERDSPPTKHDHALQLLESLNKMRSNGTVCDFTIKVGLESFPVHRSVLAACSDYFQAMFSHDVKETREGFVEMKAVESEAVKQCIDFMYTGESTFKVERAEELLHASELLQLSGLTALCFEHLLCNLEVDNCLFIRSLVQTYGNICDLDEIDDYVANCIDSVSSTEGFLQLNFSDAFRLVQLSVDNTAAWEAALRWINSDTENRGKEISKFVTTIDTFQSSLDFLLSVTTNSLVENDEKARKYMASVVMADIQRVERGININNCFLVKQYAQIHPSHSNASVINTLFNNFLMSNFELISQKGSFKDLTKSEVIHLLSSSRLVVSKETVKWDAILRWARHDPNRKHLLHELLKTLKFLHIPVDFIQQTILMEPIVKESHECKDLVMDALCEKAKSDAASAARAKTYDWFTQPEHCSDQAIAILDKESGTLNSMILSNHNWKMLGHINKSKGLRLTELNGEIYWLCNQDLFHLQKDGKWIKQASMHHQPKSHMQMVSFHSRIYVLEPDEMSYFYPKSGKWVEDLPCCVGAEFCVAASDMCIYAIGGHVLKNRVMEYIPFGPKDDRWSSIAPMSESRHNAAAAILNDNLYVLGGLCSSIATNLVEVYNINAGIWLDISPMLHPRRRFSACVADGVLYAVGGAFSDDGRAREFIDSIESWDPLFNRWETVVRMESVDLPVLACRAEIPKNFKDPTSDLFE